LTSWNAIFAFPCTSFSRFNYWVVVNSEQCCRNVYTFGERILLIHDDLALGIFEKERRKSTMTVQYGNLENTPDSDGRPGQGLLHNRCSARREYLQISYSCDRKFTFLIKMTSVDSILNFDPKSEENFYSILGCDESSTVSTEYFLLTYCMCAVWGTRNLTCW